MAGHLSWLQSSHPRRSPNGLPKDGVFKNVPDVGNPLRYRRIINPTQPLNEKLQALKSRYGHPGLLAKANTAMRIGDNYLAQTEQRMESGIRGEKYQEECTTQRSDPPALVRSVGPKNARHLEMPISLGGTSWGRNIGCVLLP